MKTNWSLKWHTCSPRHFLFLKGIRKRQLHQQEADQGERAEKDGREKERCTGNSGCFQNLECMLGLINSLNCTWLKSWHEVVAVYPSSGNSRQKKCLFCSQCDTAEAVTVSFLCETLNPGHLHALLWPPVLVTVHAQVFYLVLLWCQRGGWPKDVMNCNSKSI